VAFSNQKKARRGENLFLLLLSRWFHVGCWFSVGIADEFLCQPIHETCIDWRAPVPLPCDKSAEC